MSDEKSYDSSILWPMILVLVLLTAAVVISGNKRRIDKLEIEVKELKIELTKPERHNERKKENDER